MQIHHCNYKRLKYNVAFLKAIADILLVVHCNIGSDMHRFHAIRDFSDLFA